MLDDLMESIYAVDLGLSEDQGKEMYLRMLKDGDWRNKIIAEVRSALLDQDFSWTQFFDEHDVYSSDNESHAREYAERIILTPLRLRAEDGMSR